MKISTVSQMRRLDRTAVDRFGIADMLLMENAGLATASVISDELGVSGKRFVVLCGMGNNGGDGFVIARKLYSGGGRVNVYILGDRKNYNGSARQNLKTLERIIPDNITDIDTMDPVTKAVHHCSAIVDAMLGTGITRNTGGLYRDIIDMVNAVQKPVFSVDIPSGINGDTGSIMGAAVNADYTVTFGLPKIGNMLYPGFEHCGKLYVSHISFPPEIYDDLTVSINTPMDLPERNKAFHKGQFGNVLCIAGAAGYFGAPYFSALSFLKAGGGYSRLAAPQSITGFIAVNGSEIVFLPQGETDSGSISLNNRGALKDISNAMDMVIIGPGLSLNDETQTLVRELAKDITRPLLIDGDGITAVCKDPDIIRRRSAPTILTPHMGEMARITGLSTEDIENNRIDILRQTVKDLDAHIVLKGAHCLIGCPSGNVHINLSGNSGMASAGAGDVLTGTIAAMVTSGLLFSDGVRKGVFIHGLAGDLAAMEKGEDGITAQDLLDYLPMAVKEDRNGIRHPLADRYGGPRVI
jgi:ADP-dependent NAD(P)H-hydrate dehydratase / NAD(P)H-hydrate epimerase